MLLSMLPAIKPLLYSLPILSLNLLISLNIQVLVTLQRRDRAGRVLDSVLHISPVL